MRIRVCVLLFTLALILEAKSIDSSNSIQVILNILLGRSGRQGRGESSGSSEGKPGEVEERIRSTLEALQQHVAQLAANMSSLQNIDGTLQRIQDMAEDTNTVQENILEYLGIEDEIPNITEPPNPVTTDCASTEFACDNGNCIREGWKCDGDNDCGDGSDEADDICRPSCSSNQFQCDNEDCIDRDYICDADNDCSDASDESEYTCPHLYTEPPTLPPVLSGEEYIHLNHINTSATIRHPADGSQYHNNEKFNWIVMNDDPNAVGFRVDAPYVSVEGCCDHITIPTPGCHFDAIIKTVSDTPIFVPGSMFNLSFTSDGSVNYDGFTLDVHIIYDTGDMICPGNEKYLVLHENETRVEIHHPEHGGHYEDNEEYIWMIRNEDPDAVGFEVSIDQYDIETCCDKLRIEGQYCSYGHRTVQTESRATIRGDSVNITWKSDGSTTSSGFIIGITSLYEVNKTECFNYTCDSSGRCLAANYDDQVTWNESKAACEAEGARLVVISDQEAQDLASTVYDSDWGSPWIGLSGTVESPTWVTGLSPEDYGYENFESISDLEGNVCVFYYSEGWMYDVCNSRRSYICEKV